MGTPVPSEAGILLCFKRTHAQADRNVRARHEGGITIAYTFNLHSPERWYTLSQKQDKEMNIPLARFGLTLVVNHACNLRCAYCYTGAKFSAPMSRDTGSAAIDRAFNSLIPGGHLDLGFFGGEPLLESSRILDWIEHARTRARALSRKVNFNLTTNGTIIHREAWQVMMDGDVSIAVSFDGNPQIHDRHRRDTHGNGSATLVEATLRQLVRIGKPFQVVFVVRPDNLEEVPDGLIHLHSLGVRHVDLSLDLWTTWTASDGLRLQQMVPHAARLWRQWLPDFSLSWFDAKVADLAQLPASHATTRCGFGRGEIAVAPSGRLYPCERLVGEDLPNHPLRLPGHVSDAGDFLGYSPAPSESCAPCSRCALADACDTDCRCSNFIRTGDVNRPDGLLCMLNKATAQATVQVLEEAATPQQISSQKLAKERTCYAE